MFRSGWVRARQIETGHDHIHRLLADQTHLIAVILKIKRTVRTAAALLLLFSAMCWPYEGARIGHPRVVAAARR